MTTANTYRMTDTLTDTLAESIAALRAEYETKLAALLADHEAKKPYDYTVAPAWCSSGTYRAEAH